MGLTKDYSLAIVAMFLNILVVPENKRNYNCFLFSDPLISWYLWNLKTYFITYTSIEFIDPFSLNGGAMDY